MCKVFISRKNEGWQEIKLPDDCKRFSHEALVSRIDIYLKSYDYKGLLITENPEPFLAIR